MTSPSGTDPSSDLPPEDYETIAKRTGLALHAATVNVEDAVRELGEQTDLFSTLDAVLALRDLKRLVAAAYSEAESLALSLMGERKVEVPGIGVVESKPKKSRTQWQHDDLFKHVVARVADDPHLFFDSEDGCAKPPAAIAAALVERLRDVMSPSWKVTGLRAVGIQPDEFCTETPDGWSLVLP